MRLKRSLPGIFMLLLLLGAANAGFSQQRMRSQLQQMNPVLLNPATVGMEVFGEFKAGYAHQWAGFKGAPKTVNLTYSQGLKTQGQNLQSGLGGVVFSESTGPLTISGIGARFANHIPLGESLRLGMGVGLDMLHYRFNPLDLELVDPNDVAMADAVLNLWMPSLDGGLILYSESFYVSASARQLLQNRILLSDGNPVISSLRGHFSAQSGYRLAISESVEVSASAGFQSVSGLGLKWDVGVGGAYRRKISGSIRYRPGDAIVGGAGWSLGQKWKVDYAYEFGVSPATSSLSGSHCLMLTGRIGKTEEEGVRYFW